MTSTQQQEDRTQQQSQRQKSRQQQIIRECRYYQPTVVFPHSYLFESDTLEQLRTQQAPEYPYVLAIKRAQDLMNALSSDSTTTHVRKLLNRVNFTYVNDQTRLHICSIWIINMKRLGFEEIPQQLMCNNSQIPYFWVQYVGTIPNDLSKMPQLNMFVLYWIQFKHEVPTLDESNPEVFNAFYNNRQIVSNLIQYTCNPIDPRFYTDGNLNGSLQQIIDLWITTRLGQIPPIELLSRASKDELKKNNQTWLRCNRCLPPPQMRYEGWQYDSVLRQIYKATICDRLTHEIKLNVDDYYVGSTQCSICLTRRHCYNCCTNDHPSQPVCLQCFRSFFDSVNFKYKCPICQTPTTVGTPYRLQRLSRQQTIEHKNRKKWLAGFIRKQIHH